jgi:hypothetical protein
MLSAHHLGRRPAILMLLGAGAALLELAAGTGLAYVAGFSKVRAALGGFHWAWLLVLAGALLISFAGYFCAYRGIFRVDGGPVISRRQLCALVAADFGGFLAVGGGVLDQYALHACGSDEGEAKARVAAIAGMEQGLLALGGCAAAVGVLVSGLSRPGAGFTLPWALIPVPGFIIAFWAAERYRARFRGRAGWRGRVGTFLASIHIIRELFAHPRRWGTAPLGMALFWAADAFAVWAGLAAFGVHMNPAAFFVGFATGMVFTRRAAPLAGAGVLALILPLTIWHSGSPLAAAIAGVFTYRTLSLWLPMPVSLAVRPTLRKMGQQQSSHTEGIVEGLGEPGLQRRGG